MQYRIFPAIGIARLGEDDDFFIGPEVPGAGPQEPATDGANAPVQRFKDASQTRIRKQAARFHLFESADGAEWRLASVPAEATVTWTVTLENRKAGVKRGGTPPVSPTRAVEAAGAQAMLLKGGTRHISGHSQASEPFVAHFETTGATGDPFVTDVDLGHLRTDDAGRLLVLGGQGRSGAPPNTPLGGGGGTNFYRNPKWFDDVADGPVQAEVILAPGAAPLVADGAWVISAPPDYAPGIEAVVTLYDVLRQLGIDQFGIAPPGAPSFDLDIAPLIARARRLQWVHDDATWSRPELVDPRLRSRDPADQPLRDRVRNAIEHVEDVLEGHIDPAGPSYRLRRFQRDLLAAWVSGEFDDTAAVPSSAVTAEGLTRAALEATAGQGFCPGIEAGIILLDTTLYRTPFDFRIDHAQATAGELTALMAQPWQADFLKCNEEWWPTQRPDIAPQAAGPALDWARGALTHRAMVASSARLGFIVRQGTDDVFVEAERDPSLPG